MNLRRLVAVQPDENRDQDAEESHQNDLGSLSDLKNQSEVVQAGKPQSGCSQNPAGRGQILPVLPVSSCSIDQKNGEICTGQPDLQPISFKSDRLLAAMAKAAALYRITRQYANPVTTERRL